MESLSAVIQKKWEKFLTQLQGEQESEVKLATTKDVNEAVAKCKKSI